MANFLTYNNLVDIFRDIANRHYQINTFFLGKDWDLENDGDIQFPLLQVFPTVARLPRTVNGEFKTIEINFNCKIVDLVRQDQNNERDVHSDMLQVAQDIINELNQHPYFIRSNVSINRDIELSNLEEFEDDYSAGWEFDLNLQLINNNVFCGIPMDTISGVTFNGPVSTGYSFTGQFDCDSLIGCPTIIEIDDRLTDLESLVYANNQLISGSISYLSGLTFDITPLVYLINGTIYNIPNATQITVLSGGTQDRIDTVYVDIFGNTGVITGDESDNPVKPPVDPSTQVEISFISIPAGATTPIITSTLVWDENLGTPTEWPINIISNPWVSVSTVQSYSGTKSIRFSASTNTRLVEFSSSTVFDTSTQNTIQFAIKNTISWPSTAILNLNLLSSSNVVIGSTVQLYNGRFGFSTTNTTSWQIISIPVSNFALSTPFISKLRFTTSITAPQVLNCYIDKIQFVTGLPTVALNPNWRYMQPDVGSTLGALTPNDTLRLSGGTNITSVSSGSNIITFNLDNNIKVNSITATTYFGLPVAEAGFRGWTGSSGTNSIVNTGQSNIASGHRATILGGFLNTVTSDSSSIVNGNSNIITGQLTTIAGGYANSAMTSSYSFIGGGYKNLIDSNNYSFIGSGFRNLIQGTYSSLVGGYRNVISGSYSTIGGGRINHISGNSYNNNVVGAFIGGGKNNIALQGYNAASTIVGGSNNFAGGTYYSANFVGGGMGNKVAGDFSSIVGGRNNNSSTYYTFIGGGKNNIASNRYTAIGGGLSNLTSGVFSTIVGGNGNITSNGYATIVNGTNNIASGLQSSIINGQANSATTKNSFIGNGVENKTSGNYNSYSFIGNGFQNQALSYSSFVGSGFRNIASTYYSTIVNGRNNTVNGQRSIIGNGSNNIINGTYSSILGGQNHTINGSSSSIVGGNANTVDGSLAFIGGGNTNSASANYSIVVGGKFNTATANRASVLNGFYNNATSNNTSVIGGTYNNVNGYSSSIIGGYHNIIDSQYSTIIGGRYNNLLSTANNSSIIGGEYITGNTANTTYVPYLNVNNILSGNSQNILIRESNGDIKYRTIASIAGQSITTLQQAYNNSSTPEIVTDATLGALSIRNGSVVNANIFEGLNTGGTVTSYITGLGNSSWNTLSANTIVVGQTNIGNTNTNTTINLSQFDQFSYTLTGNTNFIFNNNINGKSWLVAVTQNSTTSGYTSSFSASTTTIKWPYNITPIQTSTVSKTDIFSFTQINGVIYGDYSQSY